MSNIEQLRLQLIKEQEQIIRELQEKRDNERKAKEKEREQKTEQNIRDWREKENEKRDKTSQIQIKLDFETQQKIALNKMTTKTTLPAWAYLLFMANIGLAIYQIVIGGQSAKLVAEYYDYSLPINGTNVRVSIDSLPRDVYKDLKNAAVIFLITGVVGVVGSVAGLIKKQNELIYFANLILVSLPFCYAAYLVWKFRSISSDDATVWNNVNTRFIGMLKKSIGILVTTSIGAFVWLILIMCAVKN